MEKVSSDFSTPRRTVVNTTIGFDRDLLEKIKSDSSVSALSAHILKLTNTEIPQLTKSMNPNDIYLEWGNSIVTVEICESLKRIMQKDNTVDALQINRLFMTIFHSPMSSEFTFAKRWVILVNIAKLLSTDFPTIYVNTYFCGINQPVSTKPIPEELTSDAEIQAYENAKHSIGRWLRHICDATGQNYVSPIFNTLIDNLPYRAVKSLYSYDTVFDALSDLNVYVYSDARNITQDIPYSSDILDETSHSMQSALYDFVNIIRSPVGDGYLILRAINKDIGYIESEQNLARITQNIAKMHPVEKYDILDAPILCKNFYLALIEHIKIKKVQGCADGYKVDMDTLEDAILQECAGFIDMHQMSATTFKDIAKLMFEYALCQCKHPAYSKYRDEILDIFSNAIKKIDREVINLHGNQLNADFLLKFIRRSTDDELELENAVESTYALESGRTKDVFKADGSSRIGNANAPDRKRPSNRSEDGKFAKNDSEDNDDKKNKDSDEKDDPIKKSKYQSQRGNAKLGISREYQIFKQNQRHILHQFNNILPILKDWLLGKKEIETVLIEGKHWTLTGLLKKLLTGAGIFAFGGVGKGILFLIIRAFARGKIKRAERRKIIMMIEEELAIIDEKINDAASDGDREAKYALMRSKQQLEHAIKRLKYGYEAERDDSAAMQALSKTVSSKGE